MRQAFRIVMGFGILFALFGSLGAGGLSSASATDTLKLKWRIDQNSGLYLYTDEVYVPYGSQPFSNPASRFGVELRYGRSGNSYWAPFPYSSSPCHFTPSPSYGQIGMNTVTYTFGYYTFPNTQPSETVSRSAVAFAVQPEDILWQVSATSGTQVTTPTLISVHGDEIYDADGFDPLLAPNGDVVFASTTSPYILISDGGKTLTIKSEFFEKIKPGEVFDVNLSYTFDNYKSGSWDWEETIPYNRNANGTYRAPSRSSVGFKIRITGVECHL